LMGELTVRGHTRLMHPQKIGTGNRSLELPV
jgi:hypothetical protein